MGPQAEKPCGDAVSLSEGFSPFSSRYMTLSLVDNPSFEEVVRWLQRAFTEPMAQTLPPLGQVNP
jgi:hypothetical protein